MGDSIAMLTRFMQPLKDRVMFMISRAVIQAVMDDKKMQLVKVSMFAGETADDIEHMQNFGFTSNPPLGSEGIVVFPGGNREHGILIACDDRATRIKDLEPGESSQYASDGTEIRIILGGKIRMKNTSEELIKVLSDLIDELETKSKVFTALGPQPFDPATILRFTALKTRLDTFLE